MFRPAMILSALCVLACGGSSGDVDAGDGSSERPRPAECDGLESEVDAWFSSNRGCSSRDDCTRMGPPELPPGLRRCRREVSSTADLSPLTALLSRYDEMGCSFEGAVCPEDAVVAVCDEGQCVGDDPFFACDRCLREPEEPVCVGGATIEHNACAAEMCPYITGAFEPGLCADTEACTSTGGSCVYRDLDDRACPEGLRFDSTDWRRGCAEAGASSRQNAFCCFDWARASECSFVGSQSQMLGIDPVTCRHRELCLIGGAQEGACEFESALYQWPSERASLARRAYDVRVSIETDYMARFEGTDPETGRTFACEGRFSAVHFGSREEGAVRWSCHSCDADGGGCETCTTTNRGVCVPRELADE